MKDKAQTQPTPQMVMFPLREWETLLKDVSFLKEAFSNETPKLGNWLSEKEAQQLLGRKYTTLWRLRTAGIIHSKKIGSRAYYSKLSIIDFLNS